MRFAAATFVAFVLWMNASGSSQTAAADPDASLPAAPIVVGDQFFAEHPDLKEEREVVKEASKVLAEEGFQPRDRWEAAEAVAAKSHKLLAERTPEEWQHKAISLYPALGVAGSEFNALFLKHYHEMQKSSPLFTDEPSWPILLARRCADELRTKPPATARSNAGIPGTVEKAPPKPATANPPRPASHPWQTACAIFLLLFATILPSIYVFRKIDLLLRARGPASTPGAPNIWRTALKHAAFLYVVIALPSAIHSLSANADLGFFDRFFVSLVVGTLFGICMILPLYALDVLWQSLHGRLIGPAGH